MKALTVKQPWASLIISAGKNIENRDWRTNYRGIIAIHSSAKFEQSEMEDACDFMRGFIPKFSSRIFQREHKSKPLTLGVILGTVEILDCVKESDSPWFCGEFGFVLANPVAFAEPIPCRGALQFWNVPEELLPGMREQWKIAAKTDVGKTFFIP